MKDINNIDKKHSINIFYLNSKINDYSFPGSFQTFKNNIISIFNLPPNSIEQFDYFYEEEKSFNIKTEEDYKNEISKIKELVKIKDINIYIEYNDNIENFEENIKSLVEYEIKSAADRIINGLKFKNNKSEELKKQEKICDMCNKLIVGDIFIEIVDDKEICYCEKCSLDIEEPKGPLFIMK